MDMIQERLMALSRRDTLVGTAATCAAIVMPSQGQGAIPKRPPLEPLGHIRVRLKASTSTADLQSYLKMYSKPEPCGASDASASAAVQDIYRDLVEGHDLRGEDLERLSPKQQRELMTIPMPPSQAGLYAYDEAVCAFIDAALNQIVDEGWIVVPSEGAVQTLAAKALLDQADNLQARGHTDEAVALCDEVIGRVGKGGHQGARAFVNKCFWLHGTSRHAESVAIFDEIWFGGAPIE